MITTCTFRCWARLCLFAAFAAAVQAQNGALAQTPASSNPTPAILRPYIVEIDDLYARAAAGWRKDLATLCDRESVQRFAERFLSLVEKFSMGPDMLGLTSDSKARLRAIFREEMFDERELLKEISAFTWDFFGVLNDYDRLVGRRLGMSQAELASGLVRDVFDASPLAKAIGRLIEVGAIEAQRDAARTVGTFAASNVIGDGARSLAAELGLFKAEPDSWEQMFAGFIMDMAIGSVVDQLTDPTDAVVERLVKEFDKIESLLLDGPSGLLTALRQATAAHKAAWINVLKTKGEVAR